MRRYTVVVGKDTNALVNKVNIKIEGGYVPVGGVAVNGLGQMAQAMILITVPGK